MALSALWPTLDASQMNHINQLLREDWRLASSECLVTLRTLYTVRIQRIYLVDRVLTGGQIPGHT